MNETEWRLPNDYEHQIIGRLLSYEFPGVRELRNQIANCVVRTIDGFGTVAIRTDCPQVANVVSRVPVEAVADDADGNAVHYLLHVINGIVEELEVFTDTTFDIIAVPSPGSLRVQVNPSRTLPNKTVNPSGG